jgi:hypothetical protein
VSGGGVVWYRSGDHGDDCDGGGGGWDLLNGNRGRCHSDECCEGGGCS